MTISIILPELLDYTARVAKELKLESLAFEENDKTYHIPINPKTKKHIIFIPGEILRTLPVAYCWEDIDRVASYNSRLRSKINPIIGNTWKKATSSRIPKSKLKKTLFEHPELIKDLIGLYKEKPKNKYDFDSDPSGEIIWAGIAEESTKKSPLDLTKFAKVTSENIFDLVKQICEQFRHLTEDNGLWEFLYNDDHKVRNERFPQKLFYGIADSYCQANDLDLSREPNAGSGALDFKISRGYNAKVTVEVKYAHNTNLIKGFLNQLPTYNKAEKAELSIYLVIQTNTSVSQIKRLKRIQKEQIAKNNKVPEIIFIDAQPQVSASKKKD